MSSVTSDLRSTSLLLFVSEQRSQIHMTGSVFTCVCRRDRLCLKNGVGPPFLDVQMSVAIPCGRERRTACPKTSPSASFVV